VADVATADPLDEPDRRLARAVDRVVELGVVEVVAGAEAGHRIVTRPEETARTASAADRDVDAAHRLEAEVLTQDEHVERQLQEVAVPDLARRGGRTRLVVDDDAARSHRIAVDAVDLAADDDARLELERPERHLQVPRHQR
jgi:hypothetical protein